MAKFERQKQDVGVKDILNKVVELSGIETNVGWFEGAKYEDGTPVAYIASIHEFGYPEGNIPPRSFMRTTIEEKKDEWDKIAKSGARAVLKGKRTALQVMEGIGLAASGDIRKKITEITSPELKETTIQAKRRKLAKGKTVGSLTKPLIETSLMLSSLTSTTEKK